ncbi:conserved hypothetical protein [Candidatus Desulfosporosinus infrequens]|uniref:DUF370 domain-containing protein n=1 Tax=Candidatus Desulfosporosinus infrequens TaxID=2043169 RepID=A0A2U3JZT3_9FIRM|nr:conserved hypothetical protein [Candidatus Desulfosporosinus infrequens]
MYLHLGGDFLIKKDKVVAIIDLETTSKSHINDKLIANLEHKKLDYISEPGKEKTLIITTDGYYLSPISSTTLFKRSSFDMGGLV